MAAKSTAQQINEATTITMINTADRRVHFGIKLSYAANQFLHSIHSANSSYHKNKLFKQIYKQLHNTHTHTHTDT